MASLNAFKAKLKLPPCVKCAIQINLRSCTYCACFACLTLIALYKSGTYSTMFCTLCTLVWMHKCKFLSNDLPLMYSVFWLFWRTMLISSGNLPGLNYGWVILRKEAPCHLPSTLSPVPNPYVTWLHGLRCMCSRGGQRGLRHLGH